MDAPAHEHVDTHADLVAWSRAYCKEVRREWVVDVRFDLVEWEVSTRAKRRAAAVKRPTIPDASVGDPLDWESVGAPDGTRTDGRPLPCTVSLTWDAFAAFDRTEWEATLRHELVHVEQYQRFGTTGHGPAFKARAADLDTDVNCPVFTDPKFVLRCGDCDALVARRYRRCKLVDRAGEYVSSCCEAPLRCEKGQPAEP